MSCIRATLSPLAAGGMKLSVIGSYFNVAHGMTCMRNRIAACLFCIRRRRASKRTRRFGGVLQMTCLTSTTGKVIYRRSMLRRMKRPVQEGDMFNGQGYL
ncbi:hypothetical protein KCP70_24275 [Salmonella enterica subsp. enterica]|nr:hypothetical protein KCP70_24275 [Salmonella enterica subsp. enterica]